VGIVVRRESLVIISNSVGGGGAENAMFDLYKGLQNKIPTKLIALNSDATSSKSEEGVLVLARKWGGGLLTTLLTFLTLNRRFHQIKPTVLIVNCELAELMIAFSPLSTTRIICVEHTSNPWIGRKPLGAVVRKILAYKGASWVTVSSNDNRIWQSPVEGKFIPNSVRVPKLKTLERQPKAVYVGRLTSGKRPEWAVFAAAQAEVDLDIFGEGPLLEDLVDLQHEIDCRVQFHGYIENCWDYISSDDVLLMPSAFEGDGIVVVQAILAGMRILLADNTDLRRFELPEECYVRDAEDMAAKLVEIDFRDKFKYRASSDARNKLLIARSIEIVSEKWLSCLRGNS
jgi:glycosyltransferase involved in cell wall biosynthesis